MASARVSSRPDDKKKAPTSKNDESLLEYEDYLVICCPKCFGFPSADSTCCRPQLAAQDQPTAAQRAQDASTATRTSNASSGKSSTTISIPADSSSSDELPTEGAMQLDVSTQSSKDLAMLSCSLPPRRPTHVTTVYEEIDDFEFDEGNRFIQDGDL